VCRAALLDGHGCPPSPAPDLIPAETLIGPGISEPGGMLVFGKTERGILLMKKKRFAVEQIVGVLKQAEIGVPVVELIRKVGISEQTFYRWKAKYVGLEIDQVRQMKQLQEENLRLKQLVAELTLDKTMLQDVLSKKW
jgi:putative transposase